MLDKVKNFLFAEDEYEYGEEENNKETEMKQVKLSKLKNVDSEVVISEPLSYSESHSIADYILANRSIIVNLHRTTPDQAKRIIDFLSGTVYAIDGSIQKIGDEIFLLAPSQVQVSGSVDVGNGEVD